MRAPHAELEGQPAYLRFTLPPHYPEAAPNLQVLSYAISEVLSAELHKSGRDGAMLLRRSQDVRGVPHISHSCTVE